MTKYDYMVLKISSVKFTQSLSVGDRTISYPINW